VQDAIGQVPQDTHGVAHTPGVTVIRLPGSRHEIVAARDKAQAMLESLGSKAGSTPEEWELREIRAGIPTILPATQEEFVPQMVNLDLIGGVSYDKGCYPGQEIVARMHYRGTLKQRMVLANIPGADPPQPGEKLYSPGFGEQACGTIVNAARSPEGGHDILAVIQISSAAKGEVRWKSLDGTALTFMPLPYKVADQA
jgi:folate-binding protein YgfZ